MPGNDRSRPLGTAPTPDLACQHDQLDLTTGGVWISTAGEITGDLAAFVALLSRVAIMRADQMPLIDARKLRAIETHLEHVRAHTDARIGGHLSTVIDAVRKLEAA